MKFESFKNARIVRSGWLEEGGRRLDCNPYMSGALEARDALVRLKGTKVPLSSVTKGFEGGIYKGPMSSRSWVDDPEYGVPFLGSGAMLDADLSTLPLMRTNYAKSPRLRCMEVTEGATLITRSGTIGRMIFVRPDMKGMWTSEHILKVVPDGNKIPPGYLFSFLSSKFGVPLVVGGTYGAIIQHIEPEHIENLPIPRLGRSIEEQVHDLVIKAANNRASATSKLNQSQDLLIKAIGIPATRSGNSMTDEISQIVPISKIQSTMRLEGYYYNAKVALVEKWAKAHGKQCVELSEIAEVFDVPLFKHIYVESGYGVPFFTSGEIFDLNRTPSKYLSKTRTVNIHKYILQRDWILLARSGQLGGIMGRPQFVDSVMDGAATSDHVIRIVPKDVPGGYLFAYLYNLSIGYPLLTRTMTGHSIPALWPSQLNSIPIVLSDYKVMNTISDLVKSAFEERIVATNYEMLAREIVEREIVGEHT